MTTYEPRWQLWIFFGVDGEWSMDGFFVSEAEAEARYSDLRDNPETPCMDDVEIVRVDVKRP